MTDLLISIKIRPILMILVNMGTRYGPIYNGLFLCGTILKAYYIIEWNNLMKENNVWNNFVHFENFPKKKREFLEKVF